jgi:hypothetical protein
MVMPDNPILMNYIAPGDTQLHPAPLVRIMGDLLEAGYKSGEPLRVFVTDGSVREHIGWTKLPAV